MFTTIPGTKRCRQCGKEKPFAFFPRDRSRPDGRWHSCRACNREYWAEHDKPKRVLRNARQQFADERFLGIAGLRRHRFLSKRRRRAVLPPDVDLIRRQLLSKYLAKHARHMTPALYASLHATAAANAPRVGDRSLGLRLRALKGWRGRKQRECEQQNGLAQLRARNQGKPRGWSTLGEL